MSHAFSRAPLPLRKHPVKGSDIHILVHWIYGKLPLSAFSACHRAANAAYTMKSILVERIHGDMLTLDVVPDIRIGPVDDWIADSFGFDHAIFK
jgi:hypothetical protein